MTDSKHIFQLALPEEDFEWALPTDDSNYKVIRLGCVKFCGQSFC